MVAAKDVRVRELKNSVGYESEIVSAAATFLFKEKLKMRRFFYKHHQVEDFFHFD